MSKRCQTHTDTRLLQSEDGSWFCPICLADRIDAEAAAGHFDIVSPDAVLQAPLVEPRTQPVTIRFERDALARLRREASAAGMPYQRLIKRIVAAWLDQREQQHATGR